MRWGCRGAGTQTLRGQWSRATPLFPLTDFPEPLGPLFTLAPPAPALVSGWRLGPYFPNLPTPQMPVAVGPYGQSQPSCFDRVKMGFVMGCAVGMAAGALFGTFSCLR